MGTVDGKYLADARREMLASIQADEAGDHTPVLRAVAAIIESLTELQERVAKLEAGGPQ